MHLTIKYLSQQLFDYLDALITLQTSRVDAYNKFDALATDQLAAVRRAHSRLAELVDEGADKKAIDKANDEYKQNLER